MKRFFMLLMVLGIGACDGEGAEAVPSPGPTDAAAAAAVRGDGASEASSPENREQRQVVYLDVRRPDEWAASRVAGAIHIPHTELASRLDELEEYRDADIVLYCRTGRRSGIAEEILSQAGFERLHNGGGLSDLQRQGVPVER